ncbi:MAG: proline dehydrogenase [Candidatus Polarisedimenticolia bacterium]
MATGQVHRAGALKRLALLASGRVAAVAARPYVAGATLEAAMTVCGRLGRRDLKVSLAYWNTGEESPADVACVYRAALEALSGIHGGCLSMKAPALGFADEHLGTILADARGTGVRLHFDSMALDSADATHACIERAARQGTSIGCTLPARWRRSQQDVNRALRLGIPVRLVKGQWEDQEFRGEVRASFLELVERLAGTGARVGVATHDLVLARRALQRLRSSATRCELELLYGLPMRPLLHLAREMRVPVRVYIPHGHGWLPYALSRIRDNPRIAWWMLRDLVRGVAVLPLFD